MTLGADHFHLHIDGTGDMSPAGSALDEVIYIYDGWGNVKTFGQDHNGVVTTGSGSDSVQITHAFAMAGTAGRSAAVTPRLSRRTSTMLGQSVSGYTIAHRLLMTYAATAGSIDDLAHRVSEIGASVGGSSTVPAFAVYKYLGYATVVGTELLPPALASNVFDGTGAYDGLDGYTHAATHRLPKVDEGDSAAAPATFGTWASLSFDHVGSLVPPAP